MHILYHHRTAGDRVEYVHIMGMVNAFREMGHTVEISSPPGCDPERSRPASPGQNRPKPRQSALRARLKRFARFAPNVIFELAELLYNVISFADCIMRRLRNGKPDMIYERTTSNSIAPTFLARHWNIPIVQEVNVTTRIGRLRPLVLRRITRRIEQWVIRRTTLFATVSETFKRMLAAHGFPPERILVCQNAIRPEEFAPEAVTPAARPRNVGAKDVVIGYVGAFVPYHRLDLLVEAARDLKPDYPNLRWLLVGDGVERPKIERLLERAKLSERFWMPGRVAHKQVPEFVAAMDVALLPHSEQFNSPMKLFECMAMGRAVLAPDVPAIREVIQDGVNGLIFQAGKPDSLKATLRRIVEDSTLRQQLGRRARQDVLEKHTWSGNAEAVVKRVQQASGNRKE